MHIARVGTPGAERPVVRLADGAWTDPQSLPGCETAELVTVGGIAAVRTQLERGAVGTEVPTDGLRFGPPIPRPGHLVCIGLNYADHAAESGMPIPEEPIVFTKAPNTLVGPDDEVRIPRGSVKTDWEVELGVIIGAPCRYLDSPHEAWSRIAGFSVSHDVSERAFQLECGGQWVKGKSCETFNPCGPWLVTPEDIPDVGALSLWLDVNGERQQTGSTASLIFDVPFLVWYLSQFMVLEPGDLINTGTPPGVGMGMNPPRFLRAGDVIELGVDGLGSQRQHVVDAP
jgi:2,4-didehydro-3-deoxy-L-rhamnonate hydrolase